MNVLSLFDGMSCGQIALERAGIKVDNYFASEIEKAPIEVTMSHYPNTVQLGDVRDIKASNLPKINLLIGGSPCQDFSKIKTNGKGIYGEKSGLFYEYIRLLKECQPEHFFLENVNMKQEYQDIISKELGVEPIAINSNVFSAQNRPRLYWTNIKIGEIPTHCPLVLGNILEETCDVDEKMYYDKPFILHDERTFAATLNIKTHDMGKRVYRKSSKAPTLTVIGGGYHEKKVFAAGCRKLTAVEYERLQTVDDNWTKVGKLSDTKRRSMLGNGWTVDVIKFIFEGLNDLPERQSSQ